MYTKLLAATLLLMFFATVSHAQSETYNFKRNPAPFDSKTLLHKQFIKPLPLVNLKKNALNSTNFSHSTNEGNVSIAPQDGMPVLKPYLQNTEYERKNIVNPHPVAPFGKSSYIYPMPNALNKALIDESK